MINIRWSLLKSGRLPLMRQQLFNLAHFLCRQPFQHITEIGIRIQPIQFFWLNQRHNICRSLTAAQWASKQPVLTSLSCGYPERSHLAIFLRDKDSPKRKGRVLQNKNTYWFWTVMPTTILIIILETEEHVLETIMNKTKPVYWMRSMPSQAFALAIPYLPTWYGFTRHRNGTGAGWAVGGWVNSGLNVKIKI